MFPPPCSAPTGPCWGRRHALCGLAALPLWPLAQAQAQAQAEPPAAALALPALAWLSQRLDNGLQVLSLPQRGSSSVAVQVWYRVGSRDDPPGRSGFAHLFEHLMFKGTRHMGDEMFDRLTEDVGGQNNAYTTEDMTVFQNEVPAHHLERLLWAEAERMAHLRVDQASLDSERQVVIEEMRERVLADPYGRLFNALPQHGFSLPAYRRPVIGLQQDLEAATLSDVQRFHARHYRPDNALLLVVGDVDAAQLRQWVLRWFGPLRAPARPAELGLAAATDRQASAPTTPLRITLTAPQVPLPALALMWPAPPASHDDAPALEVAAALLSLGDASRLNEALVYRDQIAQSVGCWTELLARQGMLVAHAVAVGGRGRPGAQSALGQLEAALLQQVRQLRQGPVTTAELARVRTQLLTAALLARQTAHGMAQAAGRAALLLGGADQADAYLARLQAVDAAQVQRVLQRYMAGPPAVSLYYRQQASA